MTTRKNVMLNTAYNILILIYPLALAPYVSRVLGAYGLGIYTYTHVIAVYFVLFALLGVSNYGNRSIAVVRENKIRLNAVFSSIFTMQAVVALVITFIYLLTVLFILREHRLYFLTQVIFVISTLFDVNWLFFGLEKFKLIVIRNTIVKLSTLAMVLIFVNTPDDLFLYTLIMSLGYLMRQIFMWPMVMKYVKFKLPKLSECTVHLRPNLVLFLPVISINLYRYIGKIMLGMTAEMSDVALYENAERIVYLPLAIVTAFNSVMMPKLSNIAAKGDHDIIKRYLNKSIQMVLMIGCAVSFGVAAIGQEFAPFFLGPEFIETGTLIVFLSPAIIAISWASTIRTQYLIPQIKEKIFVSAVIFGAIVSLISNYLLIPIYGTMGAVAGLLLAEFSVALFQTAAVRKELPFASYAWKTAPYILFGVIMFSSAQMLASILTDFFGIGLLIFFKIFVGAFIYAILCFIYLYSTKNEILYDLINMCPLKLKTKFTSYIKSP